jgi:carbonic anhydrase/acetyltransferase-like protein (isoleucine patch superfamily)
MPLSSYLNTSPVLGDRIFLHPSCQIIGDVKLGDDSSVWCNTVLRGDVNRIVIGRGTNIQDLTMGHVSHKTPAKPEGSPLIVGDYVTVGHSVILHGCTIGNECLIGMGSIIMDDVVIPDRVMVGATWIRRRPLGLSFGLRTQEPLHRTDCPSPAPPACCPRSCLPQKERHRGWKGET